MVSPTGRYHKELMHVKYLAYFLTHPSLLNVSYLTITVIFSVVKNRARTSSKKFFSVNVELHL